ncbi:MAG: site-specific DNA-methyltransferase [Candidatus Poribacteria bacterium]|nr:site-specific DNA-methyltransferase [Candidatus Poribacteria bacterium]
MPKQNFNEKLIALLKTNPDFRDESDELLPAAVKDHAWQLDHTLIRLLLSDPEIKSTFFDEIDGHWVFNHNTFIDYINEKNFLANSYTQFRNKIGLNIDGKFLRERGEVSLVWPYKDCVLEGGQTKEEEKRKEIFFNEILAQDEINRMFNPKVLTNWKRHTAAGEQGVTEIKRDDNDTIRENLIIKGNNLIALHTLKQQFRGQVKLIYIDPPYNTENDSFQYNDSFTRSAWLTFIKNRLEIAKELLRKDGFILIQIDNRELAYLKCLCDEVFDNNFRNGIIVKKGQKSLQKQFDFIDKLNAGYDTILFYSKDSTIKVPNLFKKLKGPSASSWNNHWRGTDRATMRFELFGIIPETGQWRWKKQRTYEAVENYQMLVCYIKAHGIEETDITDADIDVYYTRYVQENSILSHSDFELVRLSKNGKPEHYIPATNNILLGENWTDISVAGNQSEFSHEKNEEILKRILEWLTEKGDVILDFFAGAGTTAAVAHKINRQWIVVEQMDYAEILLVERLNKVITGEQGGISKSVKWQGGGDFIYCELMQYNQTYMDKIQSAQFPEELVALWQDIAENSFLNWYVNAEFPEEAVNDFSAIGDLEAQKHRLAELLDKNQLYVNLSEIEDADFKVSEKDKALNKKFYDLT